MGNSPNTMYPKAPNSLIIKSSNGGFIDLENINYQNIVVALDVDFNNRNLSNVKLDFICNLYVNLAANDWIEFVLSLYRYKNEENFELLTSVPYKIILGEEVPEDGTLVNISLEKNDFITFSYFDSNTLPKKYRYVVKVELNYISVEAAQIQSSTLSLIAQ
ncbi:hypothetical protein CDLVIII_3714 [Clostridium sp. DL-VIII]|uniref:hypothetical protein n=1 Tax=Clostridium sp. DL-VIII TaxID=641107 RepID=UPI00023AFE37|nr:hypothetical protein [Clostridium sp. DL-VIII]EHJ00270.1 hypothetical protein CDLVIII_3714 [Clostridium sp. DL-VIII]